MNTWQYCSWQPIETAPKTRGAIIIYCPEIRCSFFAIWDDITKVWRHFGGSSYEIKSTITHWMPSPPAPRMKMTFEEWLDKESGWGGEMLDEGNLAKAAWDAAIREETFK